MLIIGDVHRKISKYFELVKKTNRSIQVGDFGFKEEHDWHMSNLTPDHKINFGNHDYYTYLNKPHSCGNFSTIDNIFTIRGANSTDKHLRYEGIDWFANEELSYQEQLDVLDAYEKSLPDVVIAHDAPMFVATELFKFPKPTDVDYLRYRTPTRAFLEHLVTEVHVPKIFIFGHFHQSKNVFINGTRYICLAELETFNL